MSYADLQKIQLKSSACFGAALLVLSGAGLIAAVHTGGMAGLGVFVSLASVTLCALGETDDDG